MNQPTNGLAVARRPNLPLALAIYCIVVTVCAWIGRDQLNPDGVAYLRQAALIAQGRPSEAVSGYWSPVLSWCIAPLIALGFDALHAARIVLAIWGAGLVIGASVLLRHSYLFRGAGNRLTLALVALATVRWATNYITPDLLLATSLLWYFAMLARPTSHPCWNATAAGLFAGLAFLSKAYALPFFLVHFPLSLLLRAWAIPAERRLPRLAAQAFCGLLGFALLAGPWIGLLSHRHGKFTFSTVVAFNRYLVGPNGSFDVLYAAQAPEPGRISVWETPERLQFEPWSPLKDREAVGYQMLQVARSARELLRAVSRFDFFMLVPAVLGATALIGLRGWRNTATLPWIVWLLATIAVYCSGFLTVVFERRYIEPVLWPLCAAAALQLTYRACRIFARRFRPRLRPLVVQGIVALAVLSFIRPTVEMVLGVVTGADEFASIRAAGLELREARAAGPILGSAGAPWDVELMIAYHAGLAMPGNAPSGSLADFLHEVDRWNADVVAVNDRWPHLAEFRRLPEWRPGRTLRIDRNTILLFTRKR